MGNLFSSSIVGSANCTTSTSTSTLRKMMINVSHEFPFDVINKNNSTIPSGAIPIDFLFARGADIRDSHPKSMSILRGVSGITSITASSIFIWMIMRSHVRLSSTQHRLLLGLCISDIIFSLSWSTFGFTSSSDMSYYVWNARGNDVTCTAQGFLMKLGGFGGLFYNASLNLYYLAIVKYKKNDEYIRTKLEPFLHGVPIVVALAWSIANLAKKHYNPDSGGNCVRPVNEAPHCWGYDVGEIREGFEIPCYRGAEGAETAVISGLILQFIPPIIMIVALGMIYRAVRTQEKKLSRYGRGSLRANLQRQSVNNLQPDEDAPPLQRQSNTWGRRLSQSFTSLRTSMKRSQNPITRSNNTGSQSRAVMHKALGYTFAWFLSWGLDIIRFILQIAAGINYPLAMLYIASIFLPLQGLFNLLIFMYPKIVAAKKPKRGGVTVSWCRAFVSAFWSRGKDGTSKSDLRGSVGGGGGGGGNRCLPRKKAKNATDMTTRAALKNGNRLKKKKKRPSNDTPPMEEEKCEIQVPDNLDPSKTKAPYSYVADSASSTCIRNVSPSTDTDVVHDVAGDILAEVEDQQDTMSNEDDAEKELKADEEESEELMMVKKIKREEDQNIPVGQNNCESVVKEEFLMDNNATEGG